MLRFVVISEYILKTYFTISSTFIISLNEKVVMFTNKDCAILVNN